MRSIFTKYIETLADNEDIIFITGDLGYNALEGIRSKMGSRFINAGVAEQNMVGMAAGMAYRGFRVICYSIAPFVTYRCLEQIRVDICLHNLPVFIVGNGGGYGYGIMGGTHHAIEDLACLSSLPNMQCWIPTFDFDVVDSINEMFSRNGPSYLRLGKKIHLENNKTNSKSFLNIKSSVESPPRLTIISQGAVTENVMNSISNRTDTDAFSIKCLPMTALPESLKESITLSKKVLIVEEHVRRGGLAENLSLLINSEKIPIENFVSLAALGYPSGKYGSQTFHQKDSGIDTDSIRNVIDLIVNDKYISR